MSGIKVIMREPSGAAWAEDKIAAVRGVEGVQSVDVAADTPDTLVAFVPGEVAAAKPIINKIAYALPGVPLQWSSTLSAVGL
jgi:hypothetical protein